MTGEAGQDTDGNIDAALSDYCIRVIRFLSDSALDPHLYFEKKLTGDVRMAATTDELLGILTSLVAWIEETGADAPGLAVLDRSFGSAGLPTLSLLCAPATRAAGLVLACGRIRTPDEYRRVSALAENAVIAATDRRLARQLLTDHEQA